MEQKHVYAYLLLGAVVLAGAGGFMLADFDSNSIDVPEKTSFATAMSILITDINVSGEAIEEDGKTS